MLNILKKQSSVENDNYSNLINLLDTYRLKSSTIGKFQMEEMNVEVRFVLMTPKLTNILLEKHNNSNRPESKVNLGRLTKEMVNGNWYLNGDTITFDYTGEGKNGQHRLRSCINSNTTFPTIIVTGVQPESFKTMDTGRKRVGGDVLAIHGIKNASNTSAAIKTIYNFKNGKYGVNRHTGNTLSNSELYDYYLTLPNVDVSVRYGVKMTKREENYLESSIISTFHYLLGEVNSEKSVEFLDQVCLGYNIQMGSPIQSLRQKLIKRKNDKNYKMTHTEIFQNIIYTWKKFVNGEKCKNIRIPENFVMELD